VIMASTLSERGAEVTLRALQMGAADFIAKPFDKRSLQATLEQLVPSSKT